MRAIVIYASCEGQTKRIAKHIADTLSRSRVPTDTYDVTKNNADELSVDAYQAVVFGSSVHFGDHDPRIARCIRQHHKLLTEIPTAFFSVSLGIVSEHTKDRREAKRLADEFLRNQEFSPSMRTYFAGALRYSQYGWIKKHLLHRNAEKSGSPTQTDCDYEYTDWPAVRDFAEEFAGFVFRCRQPRPRGPRFRWLDKPFREYAVQNNRFDSQPQPWLLQSPAS